MAFPDRRLRIVAGNRKPGRCRDCHRPIVWVVSAPKGKRLPLNRDFVVLEREQNLTTLVHFEVISRESLHFATCAKRAKKSAPRVEQPSFL